MAQARNSFNNLRPCPWILIFTAKEKPKTPVHQQIPTTSLLQQMHTTRHTNARTLNRSCRLCKGVRKARSPFRQRLQQRRITKLGTRFHVPHLSMKRSWTGTRKHCQCTHLIMLRAPEQAKRLLACLLHQMRLKSVIPQRKLSVLLRIECFMALNASPMGPKSPEGGPPLWTGEGLGLMVSFVTNHHRIISCMVSSRS